MRTLMAWFIFAFVLAARPNGQPVSGQPAALFAQLGLSAQERSSIESGRPVAKVLSWGGPSEVYVFGAVYIDGSAADYLKMSRNIAQLAGTEGYLGIGEIPAAATEADLGALTLDPDDVKALKNCKEGDCDVQLPTASIQAFRDAVNWAQPDAANQASGLARRMLVALLAEYQRGGNKALGVYRDKKNPARVAEQFETMVGRSASLPEVVPDLRRYLLQYPDVMLPGSDNYFYWEKVDFGLKPTVRLNHAVMYHPDDHPEISAVAIKQLYASHYFHTALDVSVCVSDTSKPDRRGFYLITLKSSEQDGLTGVKGSLLRKIVVDKTKSSLERALASIKTSLEKAPRR